MLRNEKDIFAQQWNNRRHLGRAKKKIEPSCYKELCDEVNIGPWNRVYKIVMT